MRFFRWIRNEFLLLKNDYVKRWKENTTLATICIFEYFLFSSLLPLINSIPAIVTLIISFIALITFLLVISFKDKELTKAQKKIFIIYLLLSIIFGITRSYLYLISLFIAYLYKDNKASLYKWIFLTSALILTIHIILTLLGVIADLPLIRNSVDQITNIRHTFGFNHPNQVLKFFVTISISGYLWLCNNKKTTVIYSISIFLVSIFLGYHTNCKTGIIVSFVALVLMNFPIILKFVKTKWLYLAFTVITFLFLCSYWLDIDFIDRALSGRPYWFNLYVSNYFPFILFGKCYGPLWIELLDKPLDNTFMYIIFDGGLISLVAINILFYKIFKNSTDKRTKVALLIILAYGLTEALCTPFTNLLFIIMFLEMFDNKVLHFLKEEKKDVTTIN